MKIFHILLVLSVVISPVSLAGSHIDIESDPTTFALSGYALHLRYSPEAMPQVRVGIGTYALEFPSAFVDINSENRDRGWQVEIDNAIGLFVEYSLQHASSGWFVGLQLAQQDFLIQNDSISGEASFTNNLFMPYAGYRFELDAHWYTSLWGGVGYTETVSGNTQLGGLQYDVDPAVGFGALHVGYRF